MRIKTLIFLLFLFPLIVPAQVNWTYNPTAPVVGMDSSGTWGSYGQPACIIQDDTLRMFYVRADQDTSGLHSAIHYAWSADGIAWNEYAGNPVLLPGNPGSWDDIWLDTPEILHDGQRYLMLYYGDSLTWNIPDHTAIGMAESMDGTNWTKSGIVLERGGPADWDGGFIESPALHFDAATQSYSVWYTGLGPGSVYANGMARSADGLTWIKDAGNPCFMHGSAGSWEDAVAGVPAVIESDGIFEMWYGGMDSLNLWTYSRIGYAVSQNGVDWLKYPGNPVLSRVAPDSASFWAPDVVWDSIAQVYRLYYESEHIFGAYGIFEAESPRTILNGANCQTQVSADTTLSLGDTLTLSASGGSLYHWIPSYGLSDPFSSTPAASPDSSMTYHVLIVGDSCITRDSVHITVDPGTGRDVEGEPGLLRVYPHPMREIAQVETGLAPGEKAWLLLSSPEGRVLRSIPVEGGAPPALRRNGLPAGIYFLELRQEGRLPETCKLILR